MVRTHASHQWRYRASHKKIFSVEGETREDDDEIDEDEEVASRSTERRLSSISDEERSKISEAVSAQAKAIQELMNSNKFASISRSNSTVSPPILSHAPLKLILFLRVGPLTEKIHETIKFSIK